MNLLYFIAEIKEADNLILLSSIASKIKHDTPTTTTTSTHSKHNHSKHTQSKHTNSKQSDSQKDHHNSGFHKKVFVLPANSLYLPSQSDLCKLRMNGNCYSKVFFQASMSEDDVIAQIRTTFPDLGDSRLVRFTEVSMCSVTMDSIPLTAIYNQETKIDKIITMIFEIKCFL